VTAALRPNECAEHPPSERGTRLARRMLLIRRTLRLFLPLAGGLTLVVVLLARVHDSSRLKLLREQNQAVLQAADLEMSHLLQEVVVHTEAIVELPAVRSRLDLPITPASRSQLTELFRTQAVDHGRDWGLSLWDLNGTLVAGVEPSGASLPAQVRVNELSSDEREAFRLGLRLAPEGSWISAPRPGSMLVVRPVFSAEGVRRAVLLIPVRLQNSLGHFERITNHNPSLRQGLLLDADGLILNPLPEGLDAPGNSTAPARLQQLYPEVWRRISTSAAPEGSLLTDQGLFLWQRFHPLEHSLGHVLPAGEVLSPGNELISVLRLPPASLGEHTLFRQLDVQVLLSLLGALSALACLGLARSELTREETAERERVAKERLHRAVDTSPLGFCLVGVDGRFHQLNPALRAFLGRSAEDLLTTPWEQTLHPEERSSDRQLSGELQEGLREGYRLGRRFLRPDGSVVWGDLAVAAVRDPAGGLLHLVIQIADITQAMTSRAELRRSEARFRQVMERSPVGMCLFSADTGRLLEVNGALCRFLDRTPADLCTFTWPELLHPEDQAQEAEGCQPILRGDQENQPLRLRFLRPDRRVVWGDLSVTRVEAEDGPARVLIGQVVDRTELVERTLYLNTALSAGIIGLWDWDVPRDQLTWDAVTSRLYGREPGRFGGTCAAWVELVHPDDRAAMERYLQAALMNWKAFQFRFRILWPDGSIHHLQASAITRFQRDGMADRMIGVTYDVTEAVQREEALAEQRRFLQSAINSMLDPHLVLDAVRDGEGVLVDLLLADGNTAAFTFLRRSRERLIGTRLSHCLPPLASPGQMAAFAEVLERGIPLVCDDLEVDLPQLQEIDGEHPPAAHYFDLRAVKLGDGLELTWRDVTDRHLAARRLADSESHYRLLAENSLDVVLKAADDAEILWISPGIERMLGWLPVQWVGCSLLDYCHPEDRDQLLQCREKVLAGNVRVERLRLSDYHTSWRWVTLHAGPYHREDGEREGIVASFRTVDQEVAIEQELDRRARTDALTGLLNRQEVFDRLDQMAGRTRRRGEQLAILFCDIDRFKTINDTYGHAAGDAVLKSLARTLKKCTRSGDQIARIGGDELLVVLDGIQTLEEAVAVAEKIRRESHTPIRLPGDGSVTPSLSIGVTLACEGEDFDAIVVRADAAMYEAKQAGRDCVIAIGAESCTVSLVQQAPQAL
jgi:diguanylate cyclase (GGDEF)-like protein/PAS domain S-box-containing protein